MPTVAMEEVAPVNVADANMLAPEEIKSKINALPKSKAEEDKHDKKKNLRAKKLVSKKAKIKKEKRLELAQALDPDNAKVNKEIAMNKLKKQAKNMSKNIKILDQVWIFEAFHLKVKIKIIYFLFFKKKDSKSTKAYRSSTAFFKQLQENSLMDKKVVKRKKFNESDSAKSSKKLKL